MIQLLYNARIYTLEDTRPLVSAIAIDHGHILDIGTDHQILSEFAGDQQVASLNLGGRIVLPGLCDAHIHLEQYALSLQKVNCETATREECLMRVAERARQTPTGEWILGHGWNQNDWPEGFGNAGDLDNVAPDHPVFLTAKSLHAAWANHAALKAAGIDVHTPDPPQGRIDRDQDGQPTGILFERAMELIQSVIPEPNVDQVARALANALTALASMGLTSVHDFDRRRCFVALQMLHSQRQLPLRVVKNIPLEDLPYALGLGLRTGFGDKRLRIGSIKAFADGALGPRTAAMLQPYEGEPENRGMLLLDAEELFEKGRLAIENGLSLAVHAIGDWANHEVLNAFAQLRKQEKSLKAAQSDPIYPLRHRIEHVQLIHPDDAPRLAALGVTASMQPIHATSDMLMADHYWGSRGAFAYAWRTQLNYGTMLAFGSDAPVEPPNPFLGLHAAVTRRRSDGFPGSDGWYPSQKLTVLEALSAYTRAPAYLAYLDNVLGKLAPGYLADLVVLDEDPFACDPNDLKDIRPVGTMVGGQWISRKF